MSLADIIAAHNSYPVPDEFRDIWALHCDCGFHGSLPEWAAHVAAEIEKAHTLATEAELNALPVDAVVVAADEIIHERGVGRWFIPGLSDPVRVQEIPLPARVLWLPTDEAGTDA